MVPSIDIVEGLTYVAKPSLSAISILNSQSQGRKNKVEYNHQRYTKTADRERGLVATTSYCYSLHLYTIK